ncbi:MAG: cytochrome P460 family protein [Candidatus Eremiobacteraeota bacterium]|nr:cytochrome P460 family protein [Candidatus Eremiobacteraeota bacterium]MBV9409280.1 cytochrome P460 family protein [Candidatus Eremiobacteraeota bacterium]
MTLARAAAGGFALMLALVAARLVSAREPVLPPVPPDDLPHYTARGELRLPSDYRNWVWLSSGLGMSYRARTTGDGGSPPFDNVFVSRRGYEAFRRTGHWPQKTIFLVEVRAAKNHGSINKGGQFQSQLLGLEAEVKDASQFPEGTRFFSFNGATGTPIPKTACLSCHRANGALEDTFAQFYPTVFDLADRKGTLNARYLATLKR